MALDNTKNSCVRLCTGLNGPQDRNKYCGLCDGRIQGKDHRPLNKDPSQRAHISCITREIRGLPITKVHTKRIRTLSSDSAEQQPSRPQPQPQPLPSAASMPASLSTVSSGQLESSYTDDAQMNLRKQFKDFGWVRVPSTTTSVRLACDMLQLKADGLPRTKEAIDGGVLQFIPSALAENASTEIRTRWESLVKDIAKYIGIEDADDMHVVDNKMLVAGKGKGQQSCHFDSARIEEAKTTYSFLLFCSNGHNSTALPKFKSNDILSFSNNPNELKDVVNLLDEENYEFGPTPAGEIIAFRHSTPHFGVKNHMSVGTRDVLFSILSHNSKWDQDSLQVYPYHLVGHAFGWKSLAFAFELVKAAHFKPLDRIKMNYDPISGIGKKSAEQNFRIAKECLIGHELLREYELRGKIDA